MMKKSLKAALITISSLALLFVSCETPEYPSEKAVIPGSIGGKVPSSIKAADVPVNFMRGVDASEVKALEEAGFKFKDEGSEKDVFLIFASHGVNWVRFRLWNDYTKQLNSDSYPYGFCNLERTIDMAKRAKSAGLKVLLDFHYSDTWADPTKQICPDEWKSINDTDSLKTAVVDYTKDVLAQMKVEGCLPDMVQIGNEMEGGLFQTNTAFTVSMTDSLNIIKAVAAAIKTEHSSVKTMIHMSRGGNSVVLTNFYNNFIKDNPQIDVIGLSYYPFYDSHGKIDALNANIKKIVETYGKECIIAETSYGYGSEVWMDDMSNEFWTDDEEQAASQLTGYEGITVIADGKETIIGSVENQAGVVRFIMENASSAGATGLFYWGGCYLGKTNSKDSSLTMKSNWENQALFDTDGNVLESINVFN